MLTYRLLRSNKETGPYSLDDIVSMGLKPYDLVWVEGRSAAWRYPSEIEELKPYSPAVEEQPYDRFYKKPQPVTGNEVGTPVITRQELKTEEDTPKKDKQVFISMPKGEKPRILVIGKQEQDSLVEKNKTAQENPIENSEARATETSKAQPAPVISISQEIKPEPQLETKYETSLDDLKDQYIQTLIDRKTKHSWKKKMGVLTRRAAIFIYGIALGTLIMLTLTKGSVKTAVAETNSHLTDQPKTGNTTEQIPLTNELKELMPTVTDNPHSLATEQEKTKTEKHINPATLHPGKEELSQNPANPVDLVTKESPQPAGKDDNGSRNARTRDNSISSRDDILKKVTLSANDYKRAAFGGIKNLQLTVSNNSKFILDNVVVELEYLKPSELPLKTETIEFRSIAPNGSMTIKVPDNSRGIKVNYRIKTVTSGELNEELAKNNK